MTYLVDPFQPYYGIFTPHTLTAGVAAWLVMMSIYPFLKVATTLSDAIRGRAPIHSHDTASAGGLVSNQIVSVTFLLPGMILFVILLIGNTGLVPALGLSRFIQDPPGDNFLAILSGLLATWFFSGMIDSPPPTLASIGVYRFGRATRFGAFAFLAWFLYFQTGYPGSALAMAALAIAARRVGILLLRSVILAGPGAIILFPAALVSWICALLVTSVFGPLAFIAVKLRDKPGQHDLPVGRNPITDFSIDGAAPEICYNIDSTKGMILPR